MADACLQVGKGQSSLRQLQVGGRYTLPPPASGLAPSAKQPALEWQDVVTRAAQQVHLNRDDMGRHPSPPISSRPEGIYRSGLNTNALEKLQDVRRSLKR